MNSEQHPLQPFLPENTKILMLGSFPPQRSRWSMEFFYPNFQNDMWRIMGCLAAGDKAHFLSRDGKGFDRDRIETFCRERGIAHHNAAEEVIRLKNNASDGSLQVVREIDLSALLVQIPQCRAIVTTGGKATDIVCRIAGCATPAMGGSVAFEFVGRQMQLYRLPSSSRAYSKSVEWKSEFYRTAFCEQEIL